jgi:5-formyltetrahydrofolate cyclo-ligase
LIGVAHELQRVERIVPQDWDVRLDMIVTEQAIYR